MTRWILATVAIACGPGPEGGFGFGYSDGKIEVLAEWNDRQCPVELHGGGEPGAVCNHAHDCAEYCCACSETTTTFSARACDSRRCADAVVACTAAEAHARATAEPELREFCDE
jgi:hypothetical protein